MSPKLADALDPLHAAARVIGDGEGWLVGGAVRDALLGREHPDYDLAIVGPAQGPAKALARAAGGFAFSLSDDFGAWRVTARDGDWQIDLTPLTGAGLEQDLKHRDLTINAIAQPLTPGMLPGAGQLIDPCGGVTDIGQGRLRAVSRSSFRSDPLRVMRLARLAVELGDEFSIDEATIALARASAQRLSDVAAERVFAEFNRVLCADGAPAGIELLARIGALQVVAPEIESLRGVTQNAYHNRDVYGHTLVALQSLIELESGGFAALGEPGAGVRALLAEPFANDLTRGQALRWGALLHDIAKPSTRVETEDGRIGFPGHDQLGASLSAEILRRMRASERLVEYVSALTRHHLRLGFLVHHQPLSRRALYRYLADSAPVTVDVTVLSVADRIATQGRNHEEATAAHLKLAGEIIGPALDFQADPPTAPIRGDRLAAALEIAPGPVLGPLLAELTEAAYAGEISADDEESVLGFARAALAGAAPNAKAGVKLRS